MDLFDPAALSTDAHLDALDALRARGDVVEIDPRGARRTFVVLSHEAVAAAVRHPLLSSSWGTGSTDVPEAGAAGVPFRAVHMSSGAVHAALRAQLARVVAVDDALRSRVRDACVVREGEMDALAFAMRVQRAAMGPRFDVDDATLDRNIALVHRAAFATHDEPLQPNVSREVDAGLVGERGGDDAAWLMRFAWLTAFVTTELALVHMLESLASYRGGDRARFVDECLRVHSPVARFGRVAVDDVTIANVTVPRGARVLLSFAAANHDPRVFPNPRAIAVARPATRHFAFGAGEHACAGANVAIAILRTVLDAVVDMRVHVDAVEHVPLRSHVNRGARASRVRIW